MSHPNVLSSSFSSRSDLNDNDVSASNLSLSKSSSKPASSSSAIKKSSSSARKWYNPFYPNYKSRAEDFKKIFAELTEERLVRKGT